MSKDESMLQDDADSRERLETDVLSIVRNAAIWARQKIEHGEGGLFMLDKYDPMIRDLLDRQAAITETEFDDRWAERIKDLEQAAAERDHFIDAFNQRGFVISELEAERDKLKKRIVELEDKITSLESDLDDLIDHRNSLEKRIVEIEPMGDSVDHPKHYPAGSIEIIEQVIDGLDSKSAYFLGNVLKYVIRAGKKNDDDLDKANNYAHRLCTGKWRWEEGVETYPYAFPDATEMADDWMSQAYKIKEECDEVMEIVKHIEDNGVAFVGSLHEMLIEVLDVIHACETLLRFMDWNKGSAYYYDIVQLRDEVIEKNRERGYYGQDAKG